jgi:hypothetical protein
MVYAGNIDGFITFVLVMIAVALLGNLIVKFMEHQEHLRQRYKAQEKQRPKRKYVKNPNNPRWKK